MPNERHLTLGNLTLTGSIARFKLHTIFYSFSYFILIWFFTVQGTLAWYYINSPCECKKVISGFLQFLRGSHFMLKFPLFFVVFSDHICHKIKNILICDHGWSLKCVFFIDFFIKIKTLFSPKCQLLFFFHSHDVSL